MPRKPRAIQAIEENRPQIYIRKGGKRLVVKTDPADGILNALNASKCWVCQGMGSVRKNTMTEDRMDCPKCNKEKLS